MKNKLVLLLLLSSFIAVRSSLETTGTAEIETHGRDAQTQRQEVTGWKLNRLFSEHQITTNPVEANDYTVEGEAAFGWQLIGWQTANISHFQPPVNVYGLPTTLRNVPERTLGSTVATLEHFG